VAVIAEDFTLKDSNGIRVPVSLTTPPSAVHHADLRIHYQKNQDHYQVLTYSASTASPATCPVRAILRILQQGIRLHLPSLHPVAVLADSSSPCGFSFITGVQYTKWLQSLAMDVYRLPHTNPVVATWGTHSLRVTAANLLHCAQFSAEFIKNCLH
jgi:hypothetical protein